jgi:small conductance mechanosensitive channel
VSSIEDFWNYFAAESLAVGRRLPLAVVIVAAAWALSRALAGAVSAVVLRHEKGDTLATPLRSTVRALVLVTGTAMALDHLGVPIGPVLAGAGVLGLAVGFGAQSLVKDVISGFFHIVDGVISVGDEIELGNVKGVVEEVGLRVTKVRAFSGQLWYVPNGAIDRVGNFSRGWNRVTVEVRVPHEPDARRAMPVLSEVGEVFLREQRDVALGLPEVEAALEPSAGDVTVRLGIKVKAHERWNAERELRSRVKEALAREGIAAHSPQ